MKEITLTPLTSGTVKVTVELDKTTVYEVKKMICSQENVSSQPDSLKIVSQDYQWKNEDVITQDFTTKYITQAAIIHLRGFSKTKPNIASAAQIIAERQAIEGLRAQKKITEEPAQEAKEESKCVLM